MAADEGSDPLRVEAERLRRLFREAPGFMAVARGPDHVFEMVNDAYLQLVGHRDLIGKPVREAVPEVKGQGLFSLLDRVFASGKPFTGRGMKVALQRSPGAAAEERLVDFIFQPIGDGDGKVTGIFVQGYDITDQHVAEAALRESEERFRRIADSAPVPMWVTKLDRSRGFVNIAYAEFLGVSYDDALHFDWRTIVHPDDGERLVAESLAGEATLKPFVLEARYRRADGEWRWLRSESQPRWGPEGEHEGFIGVAHDITASKVAEAALRELNETLELKVAERTAELSKALDTLQAETADRVRAEEALRQAQKMEAVGQLTGGIAHDFNNLLTPIVGALDMVRSRIDDVRLKRIAETALESARRGAKLTSQLLAFSRLQRISMKPVAVNEVILNMRDFLQHAIGKAVRIETRLDPQVGWATCDENQLENAILNLAINARDAMPGGGMVAISTSPWREAEGPDLAPGDYVRVTVGDKGEGMTAEVLARATEPFYSTKPLGKGTGLGLAQVYGIAQQSGGTVRIESEPGSGTRVHILLPRAQAGDTRKGEDGAAEAREQEQDRGNGASILIIDDDHDVRSFLTDVLEAAGHRVEEADGGESGLRKFAEGAPDLILLDFAMPGMNGAEVARAIRRERPEQPIIFVTGYAESEQLEAALGPDVQVLRKPFSIAELTAAVAATFG